VVPVVTETPAVPVVTETPVVHIIHAAPVVPAVTETPVVSVVTETPMTREIYEMEKEKAKNDVIIIETGGKILDAVTKPPKRKKRGCYLL
jgi:hypothetical protein